MNVSESIYTLIHSPLVGPLTWKPVAEEMRRRALETIVPVLTDSPASREPFWKQHAESVAETLARSPGNTRVTLVAHSGAGPLLPAIRQSIANPVNAYVFVDAGLPRNRATRLDLMKSEDPKWTAQFQEYLESGGLFPNWTAEDLQEIIPDQSLRQQMMAEMRQRGLSFFTEPIPVFNEWPDAPCIYIQFSQPYEKPAAQARESGWPTYKLESGHFHMLADPDAVANLIDEAVNKSS